MSNIAGARAFVHYYETRLTDTRLTDTQRERFEAQLAEARTHLERKLAAFTADQACHRCGRRVYGEESLRAYEVDHLGPDCRRKVAAAVAS